jgi:GT2 family glycosyltransferase
MTILLPRSDEPRVSIIIPSSVRTDLLYSCLQSLVRSGPRQIPCETIVVLNETGPEVEAELRKAASGIEIVHAPVNLGVAGAANLGRSLARGEFLALLHDDAEVLPGWMEALVEAADAHPEAGAIGSKMLNPDGSLQNVGAILWQDARTSPPWAGNPPPASAFDRIEAADYCGTASLLVRASAWDAIGGADEQIYPAYYVDVDLCTSLWEIGAAVLCQPKSQVHHRRSASTRSRFRDFIALRNRAYFQRRWAAALEQQEPFDDNSPASIARAGARAQQAWEQCRAGGSAPKGSRRVLDRARQLDECYGKSQALQKSYAEHLESLIEKLEADRNGLQQWATSLVREKQQLEHSLATLARETEKLEQTYHELAQDRQHVGRAYEALEREKQALDREQRELEATHAALAQRYAALEQAYGAILSSRSWRITAPLRHLGMLVKPRSQ